MSANTNGADFNDLALKCLGAGVCVSVGVCVDDGWLKKPHLAGSNQTQPGEAA